MSKKHKNRGQDIEGSSSSCPWYVREQFKNRDVTTVIVETAKGTYAVNTVGIGWTYHAIPERIEVDSEAEPNG